MNPLLFAWVWNPAALLGAAAALVIYFGCHGWSRRAWWMLAATAIFLLALVSPLAALARNYLFCAHMLQHILLMLAVPAFVLMAFPPREHLPNPRINPVVSWICGIAAMWVWHIPALCDAAASLRAVSAFQTVSLLGLGALFWWQLLSPDQSQRIPPLGGVLYLFMACTACTVLGIILTFAPVTVCKAYLHPADTLGIMPMLEGQWGLTPLRDQQIGGLIMWVPMCLAYAGAIFGQIARWYAAPAALHHT